MHDSYHSRTTPFFDSQASFQKFIIANEGVVPFCVRRHAFEGEATVRVHKFRPEPARKMGQVLASFWTVVETHLRQMFKSADANIAGKITHAKPNQFRRRKSILRKLLRPEEKARSTCTDNCLFFSSCDGLNWNRERSTRNKSETGKGNTLKDPFSQCEL